MYLIWVGMKSWFFCLFLPLLRQSEEAAEAVSQVVVGVVDVLLTVLMVMSYWAAISF